MGKGLPHAGKRFGPKRLLRRVGGRHLAALGLVPQRHELPLVRRKNGREARLDVVRKRRRPQHHRKVELGKTTQLAHCMRKFSRKYTHTQQKQTKKNKKKNKKKKKAQERSTHSRNSRANGRGQT
jgi:hypothetical protein